MTQRERFLAQAQLVRLPNVFTAFADILLGLAAAGGADPVTAALLLAGSGALYAGGMALNDWFDRHEDARTRPQRPIPSGRVHPGHAAAFGFGLLALGWMLASQAVTRKPFPDSSGGAALLVAGAVVLYDGWLKRTPLGPVGMGLCRFLNVLLGLSAGAGGLWAPPNLHLAAVVGLYIVGVTWFARTEEGESQRSHLLSAAGVMGLSLALALALPLHRDPGTTFAGFPYLLVGFGFWVGVPIAAAVQEPSPKRVQAAVKACVLGLVLLDASLATAFVGPWGLSVALLLLPARYLGRWVYST